MNDTFDSTARNANSILNAFSKKFATKVNAVYVNSLKREVNFREVSVNEQKTLSKTMIGNENRIDLVYDAQCALINRLCLENDNNAIKEKARLAAKEALPEAIKENKVDLQTPEGAAFVSRFTNEYVQKYVSDNSFDIYNLTEFDRLRILVEIYQNNYVNEEITFKCKECGYENKYKLDFSKVIERFNGFDLSDKTYTLEDKDFVYNFILNYPTVRNISQFYKDFAKHYKNASSKEKDVVSTLENMDYINLYIKRIEIVDKKTNAKDVADLTFMTYNDIEKLISMFPQNIVFSEKDGVMQYIVKNLIMQTNSVFQREKCIQCGAEAPDGINSFSDFL